MHIREKKGGMERFVDNELFTALAVGHAYIIAFSYLPWPEEQVIHLAKTIAVSIYLSRGARFALSVQCNWTIHINLF